MHSSWWQIDPQLLFQRLVLAWSSPEDLESIFAFELCSCPTVPFHSPVSLRQPQKPALADAIWAKLPPDTTWYVQYVLDGGALLHRIPWLRGTATYQDICNLSCKYFSKKYGEAIVVFDGCNTVSTKAIPIKCFVSHRPPLEKVGSVGRIKKKSKNNFKVIQFL